MPLRRLNQSQPAVTITAPTIEPMSPLGRRSRPSPASRLISRPPTKEPISPAQNARLQSIAPCGLAQQKLCGGARDHAEEDDCEDQHGRSLTPALPVTGEPRRQLVEQRADSARLGSERPDWNEKSKVEGNGLNFAFVGVAQSHRQHFTGEHTVDASKLTSRSVEVVNAASTLAVNEGNPPGRPGAPRRRAAAPGAGHHALPARQDRRRRRRGQPCARPGAVEPAQRLRLDGADARARPRRSPGCSRSRST